MSATVQQGLSEERLRECEAKLRRPIGTVGWEELWYAYGELITEVRRLQRVNADLQTARDVAVQLAEDVQKQLDHETKHPLGDEYRPSPSWLATGAAEGYDL